MKKKSENQSVDQGRRKTLKSLVTYSALGAVALTSYKQKKFEQLINTTLLGSEKREQELVAFEKTPVEGETIRLGIIGTGGRGRALLEGAGFVSPSVLSNWKRAAKHNKDDHRYENFMQQPDLNVVVNGVCDIYDDNASKGMEAAANVFRNTNKSNKDHVPKRYKTYKELLQADDIDAVIIATPDHWHATMIIDAAIAGKHVYCEKPMTHTVEEAVEVEKVVKENGIVFQLGHQNRQLQSYELARQAYEKGLIGEPNLVEITTNRNSPVGAWIYPIPRKAGEANIDWEQFIGPAPYHAFSLKRFFRWRCWWDYSSGLSGDLFTHDYDAMNQILSLGIPESAVASGGIYHYKDGRTVPDVLQMAFEYPHKNLSLLYSASLASNKQRGRTIMGNDGYMEVGSSLKVYADPGSEKYKKDIKKGIVKLDKPIFSFTPGERKVDAVTSPTQQYFAGRGLLFTYQNGKQVNTTFLHILDWINAIRENGLPACNINKGFEEAITANMGTVAYRENRKVYWDKESKKVV